MSDTPCPMCASQSCTEFTIKDLTGRKQRVKCETRDISASRPDASVRGIRPRRILLFCLPFLPAFSPFASFAMDDWIASVERTIGGCSRLIGDIASQIHTLKLSAFSQCSSTFPRSSGSVIYGKPGTGKTALALALAGAYSYMTSFSVPPPTYLAPSRAFAPAVLCHQWP